MDMLRNALLLALILTVPVQVPAENEGMHVAILDLEPNDVSPSVAKTVTDMLCISLFKTGKFKILERSEMDAILREQNLQLSAIHVPVQAAKHGAGSSFVQQGNDRW